VLLSGCITALGVGRQVSIEYFYETGCPVCRQIDEDVIPELESQYAGVHTLMRRDTGIDTNYLILVGYQETLGGDNNASAVMVIDGRRMLSGWESIHERLLPTVAEALSVRLEPPESVPTAATAGDIKPSPTQPVQDLMDRRLMGFTLAGVAAAGLTDGINPCAIGTLVFFLSLLALLKASHARLLAVGLVFCAASFLTYTAIGFGLLRVLHAFSGFHTLRSAFELVLSGILIVFAGLSIRDAVRYRRTHKANAVHLQLPNSVKALIRRTLHHGLDGHHVWTGAFVSGALVTALESVCTGQVYVPTLVFMLKRGASPLRALGYLVVYNLMFVLPILVALVLTARGLRTLRLLEWSRKNVVAAKLLLALFFVTMATILASF
jgi:cytochrome c biogenesis protein CcdA